MNTEKSTLPSQASSTAQQSLFYRFGQWIQDPMGSVIAASAATIGSFGLVISGMWLISLAVN
jgi:hypothetical protein